MTSDEEKFEQIKNEIREINGRLDILSILEFYGIEYEESSSGRYKCICPFHNDHSPSLNIYTDNDHGEDSWSCYVCNINGDCFRFIRQMSDDHKQAKQIASSLASGQAARAVSARHKAIQKKLKLKKKLFINHNELGVRYREWLLSLKDSDKYEEACKRVDSVYKHIDYQLLLIDHIQRSMSKLEDDKRLQAEKQIQQMYEELRKYIKERLTRLKKRENI